MLRLFTPRKLRLKFENLLRFVISRIMAIIAATISRRPLKLGGSCFKSSTSRAKRSLLEYE